MGVYRRPFNTAVLLIFCLSQFFSFLPAAQGAASPMREIVVGVAVTPEFQRLPDWKATFKKRLRYASSILEREFRIKLKEAVFWTWVPEDQEMGTRALLDQLMRNYSLDEKNVDIMIGLAQLTDISGALNVQDLHVLGRARPFSGYMLLRYPNHPLFRIQEETILIHELGHLFGAMHTKSSDTIMAPYADRHIPTTFDAESRQIISVTRNVDFRKDVAALDAATIQHLLNAYSHMTLYDQSAEFYYALAKFYLKLKDERNAAAALEKVSELEPDNGRVLYDLGVLYHRLGDVKKAVKKLTEAVTNINPQYEKKNLTACYNSLGTIYFQAANMSGAHYAWSKALSLDPENLDIKINLAIVQLKQGQISSAQNALEKALAKDPSNVKVLIHLGHASYLNKKYTESVKYFEAALQPILAQSNAAGSVSEEDKNYLGDIYAGLGMAFWMLNDHNTSVQYFDRACRSDPTAACKGKLGKIYFELEQYENAIGLLVEALKENKEDAELYGLVGVALSRKGDMENAISFFQEGLRYVKDSEKAARLHANSGHLYMNLRRLDAAVTEFMNAVSRDYRNVDAHFGLGLAYLAKGQAQDAKQSMQNVLALDPKNQKARELIVQADQILQQMQQSQEISISFG